MWKIPHEVACVGKSALSECTSINFNTDFPSMPLDGDFTHPISGFFRVFNVRPTRPWFYVGYGTTEHHLNSLLIYRVF